MVTPFFSNTVHAQVPVPTEIPETFIAPLNYLNIVDLGQNPQISILASGPGVNATATLSTATPLAGSAVWNGSWAVASAERFFTLADYSALAVQFAGSNPAAANYATDPDAGWHPDDSDLSTTRNWIRVKYENVGFYQGQLIDAVVTISVTPFKNRTPGADWANFNYSDATPWNVGQEWYTPSNPVYWPIIQLSSFLGQGWAWQNVNEFNLEMEFYFSGDYEANEDPIEFPETDFDDDSGVYYTVNSLNPAFESEESVGEGGPIQAFGPEFVLPATGTFTNSYVIENANIVTSYNGGPNAGIQFAYSGGTEEWGDPWDAAQDVPGHPDWNLNSVSFTTSETSTINLTLGNLERDPFAQPSGTLLPTVNRTNFIWASFESGIFEQNINPDINLVKTATHLNNEEMDPLAYSQEGDVITYTFEVENTGNVALENVRVEDPLEGLSAITPASVDFLLPGTTTSFTATYTVTITDVNAGEITNTATAFGDFEGDTIEDQDDEIVMSNTGSISGTITIDTTGDGIGDTPHVGVSVALLDENGAPVTDGNNDPITTETDSDGNYTFENVPVGLYQVAQTVPDGFEAIDDVDGGDLTIIGDQTPVEVSSGQDVEDQDFVNRPANNTTYAVNDINQTPKGVSVGGNVLTNDFDLQGDDQTVTGATFMNASGNQVTLGLGASTPIFGFDDDGTIVAAGEITLNADGSYDYVPDADFTGTVPLTYTIEDDNVNTATDDATLTILVTENTQGVNNPPLAQDDTAITREGVPVTGNVLDNDSDPDGDPIEITEIFADTNGDGTPDNAVTSGSPTTVYGTDLSGNTVVAGQITIDEDTGEWTFDPAPGFIGDVPVDYTIADVPGGLTDSATLTITVVPDTGNQTFANDDVNLGQQGETLTGNILDNDFDPEGDDQTITQIDTNGDGTPDTAPTAGTPITITQDGDTIGELTVDPNSGAYIWVPELDFVGTAVIAYQTCDDGTPQACATATLYLTNLGDSITGEQVPDVTPVITAIPNIMTGPTTFNIIIQVIELNLTDTEGLITVLVPKDSRWELANPYDEALTELSNISLNNSAWEYSENSTHHIFTTTTTINAGSFSRFGFEASWNAGQTQGEYTITAQIVPGSGGEDRVNNNTDAEVLEYFIN